MFHLCCLSFFDLRILINPLISSNSSFPSMYVWTRVSKDKRFKTYTIIELLILKGLMC
jgi:hypothetical protein